MRRPGVGLGVALVLALAIFAVPAAAGQIVYQHGADIWAMNDDGSGPHPVVTVAQVPGMSSIGGAEVFPNGGTALAFEGTTLAYLAPAGSGPGGACGLNCTGIYTYAGGTVTRLTAPAAPCGPAPQWCGSFSTSPAWTANGEIAYEDSLYTWEYSCLSRPCGWRFSSADEEIHTVPPSAGAGLGRQWDTEHGRSVLGPGPIPDPADPGKLAYVGDSVCEAGGCAYPLYLGTGSGTDAPVAYDDDLIEAAWSPDGGRFADVEGGGERGIWTYSSDPASPGKQFTWALEDPLQTGSDPGENPFDVSFEGVAWLGTGTIVFAAADNLWTIPASCGSGGQPCEFPADAVQLTHDGSAAAPDVDPAWTSATAPIEAPAASTPAAAGASPAPASSAPAAHKRSSRSSSSGGAARSGPAAKASHASLAGLARRRPRLAFTLAAPARAPLRKVAVRLPHGLGFAPAPARRLAGISLRGRRGRALSFTVRLRHGTLVLVLKRPARKAALAISRPAIFVTKALAAKVGRGQVRRLPVSVVVTAGKRAAHLRLALRPR